MSEYTEKQRIALAAYRKSTEEDGANSWDAAQEAWEVLRRTVCRRRRAPFWNEAISLNTSRRRSYICPLGEELEIEAGSFGQYCLDWPRTKQSVNESCEVSGRVLAWLETNS
jgi:hypothetical protein